MAKKKCKECEHHKSRSEFFLQRVRKLELEQQELHKERAEFYKALRTILNFAGIR